MKSYKLECKAEGGLTHYIASKNSPF
ncbi:modified peptide precursor CbpA [Ferroglobus placidus]